MVGHGCGIFGEEVGLRLLGFLEGVCSDHGEGLRSGVGWFMAPFEQENGVRMHMSWIAAPSERSADSATGLMCMRALCEIKGSKEIKE